MINITRVLLIRALYMIPFNVQNTNANCQKKQKKIQYRNNMKTKDNKNIYTYSVCPEC